jgi:predicted glutamine amidotransferase
MCRLLSYVSARESAAARTLANVAPAFTAMSSAHADGWGIAWRGPDGVRGVREARSARRSPLFGNTVASVITDAAILHLRDATTGLPIDATNTHPFVRDGFAFMHNGFVGPIGDIDAMIDSDLVPIGRTDSERYFLAVLTEIRAGRDVADALLAVADRVVELAGSTSANAMLLSSEALHVVCAYRPGRQPPEFGEDYFALRYLRTDESVVIGSTGIEQAGWTDLPERSVLTLDRRTMSLDLRVAPDAIQARTGSVVSTSGTC